jgi:hypothetical protein
VPAIEAVEAIQDEFVAAMPSASGDVPVPRRSWILPTRRMTGHIEATCMYAGESVALVQSVVPAGRLVRSLVDGAEALLAGLKLS